MKKTWYFVDAESGARVAVRDAVPGKVYQVFDKVGDDGEFAGYGRLTADKKLEFQSRYEKPDIDPLELPGAMGRSFKEGLETMWTGARYGLPAIFGDEENVAQLRRVQEENRRERELATPLEEQLFANAPLWGEDGVFNVSRVLTTSAGALPFLAEFLLLNKGLGVAAKGGDKLGSSSSGVVRGSGKGLGVLAGSSAGARGGRAGALTGAPPVAAGAMERAAEAGATDLEMQQSGFNALVPAALLHAGTGAVAAYPWNRVFGDAAKNGGRFLGHRSASSLDAVATEAITEGIEGAGDEAIEQSATMQVRGVDSYDFNQIAQAAGLEAMGGAGAAAMVQGLWSVFPGKKQKSIGDAAALKDFEAVSGEVHRGQIPSISSNPTATEDDFVYILTRGTGLFGAPLDENERQENENKARPLVREISKFAQDNEAEAIGPMSVSDLLNAFPSLSAAGYRRGESEGAEEKVKPALIHLVEEMKKSRDPRNAMLFRLLGVSLSPEKTPETRRAVEIVNDMFRQQFGEEAAGLGGNADRLFADGDAPLQQVMKRLENVKIMLEAFSRAGVSAQQIEAMWDEAGDLAARETAQDDVGVLDERLRLQSSSYNDARVLQSQISAEQGGELAKQESDRAVKFKNMNAAFDASLALDEKRRAAAEHPGAGEARAAEELERAKGAEEEGEAEAEADGGGAPGLRDLVQSETLALAFARLYDGRKQVVSPYEIEEDEESYRTPRSSSSAALGVSSPPVILHRRLDGRLFVVDGFGRVRAAKEAGGEIEAEVFDERDVSVDDMRDVAAAINIISGNRHSPSDLAAALYAGRGNNVAAAAALAARDNPRLLRDLRAAIQVVKISELSGFDEETGGNLLQDLRAGRVLGEVADGIVQVILRRKPKPAAVPDVVSAAKKARTFEDAVSLATAKVLELSKLSAAQIKKRSAAARKKGGDGAGSGGGGGRAARAGGDGKLRGIFTGNPAFGGVSSDAALARIEKIFQKIDGDLPPSGDMESNLLVRQILRGWADAVAGGDVNETDFERANSGFRRHIDSLERLGRGSVSAGMRQVADDGESAEAQLIVAAFQAARAASATGFRQRIVLRDFFRGRRFGSNVPYSGSQGYNNLRGTVYLAAYSSVPAEENDDSGWQANTSGGGVTAVFMHENFHTVWSVLDVETRKIIRSDLEKWQAADPKRAEQILGLARASVEMGGGDFLANNDESDDESIAYIVEFAIKYGFSPVIPGLNMPSAARAVGDAWAKSGKNEDGLIARFRSFYKNLGREWKAVGLNNMEDIVNAVSSGAFADAVNLRLAAIRAYDQKGWGSLSEEQKSFLMRDKSGQIVVRPVEHLGDLLNRTNRFTEILRVVRPEGSPVHTGGEDDSEKDLSGSVAAETGGRFAFAPASVLSGGISAENISAAAAEWGHKLGVKAGLYDGADTPFEARGDLDKRIAEISDSEPDFVAKIWRQTGLILGRDGKFRAEFDDSVLVDKGVLRDLKTLKEKGEVKGRDHVILPLPDGGLEFEEEENRPVVVIRFGENFVGGRGDTGKGAYFTTDGYGDGYLFLGNKIKYSEGTERDGLRSVMAHEMQHAVQWNFGLVAEDDDGAMRPPEMPGDDLETLRGRLLADVRSEETYGREFRKMFRRADSTVGLRNIDAYRRSQSEAEAREVQARLGKSAAWRAKNPPQWDGVPMRDIIVDGWKYHSRFSIVSPEIAGRPLQEADAKWTERLESDFSQKNIAKIRDEDPGFAAKVWRKTGIILSVDGKYRAELPDGWLSADAVRRMRDYFNPQKTAPDAMWKDHSTIGELFPDAPKQIADIEVTQRARGTSQGASFSAGSNSINVSPVLLKQTAGLRSAMAHEIQHAWQREIYGPRPRQNFNNSQDIDENVDAMSAADLRRVAAAVLAIPAAREKLPGGKVANVATDALISLQTNLRQVKRDEIERGSDHTEWRRRVLGNFFGYFLTDREAEAREAASRIDKSEKWRAENPPMYDGFFANLIVPDAGAAADYFYTPPQPGSFSVAAPMVAMEGGKYNPDKDGELLREDGRIVDVFHGTHKPIRRFRADDGVWFFRTDVVDKGGVRDYEKSTLPHTAQKSAESYVGRWGENGRGRVYRAFLAVKKNEVYRGSYKTDDFDSLRRRGYKVIFNRENTYPPPGAINAGAIVLDESVIVHPRTGKRMAGGQVVWRQEKAEAAYQAQLRGENKHYFGERFSVAAGADGTLMAISKLLEKRGDTLITQTDLPFAQWRKQAENSPRWRLAVDILEEAAAQMPKRFRVHDLAAAAADRIYQYNFVADESPEYDNYTGQMDGETRDYVWNVIFDDKRLRAEHHARNAYVRVEPDKNHRVAISANIQSGVAQSETPPSPPFFQYKTFKLKSGQSFDAVFVIRQEGTFKEDPTTYLAPLWDLLFFPSDLIKDRIAEQGARETANWIDEKAAYNLLWGHYADDKSDFLTYQQERKYWERPFVRPRRVKNNTIINRVAAQMVQELPAWPIYSLSRLLNHRDQSLGRQPLGLNITEREARKVLRWALQHLQNRMWENAAPSIAQIAKEQGFVNLIQAAARQLKEEGFEWFGAADARTMAIAQGFIGGNGHWNEPGWVALHHPDLFEFLYAQAGIKREWAIDLDNPKNPLQGVFISVFHPAREKDDKEAHNMNGYMVHMKNAHQNLASWVRATGVAEAENAVNMDEFRKNLRIFKDAMSNIPSDQIKPDDFSLAELLDNKYSEEAEVQIITRAYADALKPDGKVDFVYGPKELMGLDRAFYFFRKTDVVSFLDMMKSSAKTAKGDKMKNYQGAGAGVVRIYQNTIPRAMQEAAKRMGVKSYTTEELQKNKIQIPADTGHAEISRWIDLRALDTTRPMGMFSAAAANNPATTAAISPPVLNADFLLNRNARFSVGKSRQAPKKRQRRYFLVAGDAIREMDNTKLFAPDVYRQKARELTNKGQAKKAESVLLERALATLATRPTTKTNNGKLRPNTVANAMYKEADKYEILPRDGSTAYFAFRAPYADENFPQYRAVPYEISMLPKPYSNKHFALGGPKTVFWSRYQDNENERLIVEMQSDVLSEQIGRHGDKAHGDDVLLSLAKNYFWRIVREEIARAREDGKSVVYFPTPAAAGGIQSYTPLSDTQYARTGYGNATEYDDEEYAADPADVEEIRNAYNGEIVDWHGDPHRLLEMSDNDTAILGAPQDFTYGILVAAVLEDAFAKAQKEKGMDIAEVVRAINTEENVRKTYKQLLIPMKQASDYDQNGKLKPRQTREAEQAQYDKQNIANIRTILHAFAATAPTRHGQETPGAIKQNNHWASSHMVLGHSYSNPSWELYSSDWVENARLFLEARKTKILQYEEDFVYTIAQYLVGLLANAGFTDFPAGQLRHPRELLDQPIPPAIVDILQLEERDYVFDYEVRSGRVMLAARLVLPDGNLEEQGPYFLRDPASLYMPVSKTADYKRIDTIHNWEMQIPKETTDYSRTILSHYRDAAKRLLRDFGGRIEMVGAGEGMPFVAVPTNAAPPKTGMFSAAPQTTLALRAIADGNNAKIIGAPGINTISRAENRKFLQHNGLPPDSITIPLNAAHIAAEAFFRTHQPQTVQYQQPVPTPPPTPHPISGRFAVRHKNSPLREIHGEATQPIRKYNGAPLALYHGSSAVLPSLKLGRKSHNTTHNYFGDTSVFHPVRRAAVFLTPDPKAAAAFAHNAANKNNGKATKNKFHLFLHEDEIASLDGTEPHGGLITEFLKNQLGDWGELFYENNIQELLDDKLAAIVGPAMNVLSAQADVWEIFDGIGGAAFARYLLDHHGIRAVRYLDNGFNDNIAVPSYAVLDPTALGKEKSRKIQGRFSTTTPPPTIKFVEELQRKFPAPQTITAADLPTERWRQENVVIPPHLKDTPDLPPDEKRQRKTARKQFKANRHSPVNTSWQATAEIVRATLQKLPPKFTADEFANAAADNIYSYSLQRIGSPSYANHITEMGGATKEYVYDVRLHGKPVIPPGRQQHDKDAYVRADFDESGKVAVSANIQSGIAVGDSKPAAFITKTFRLRNKKEFDVAILYEHDPDTWGYAILPKGVLDNWNTTDKNGKTWWQREYQQTDLQEQPDILAYLRDTVVRQNLRTRLPPRKNKKAHEKESAERNRAQLDIMWQIAMESGAPGAVPMSQKVMKWILRNGLPPRKNKKAHEKESAERNRAQLDIMWQIVLESGAPGAVPMSQKVMKWILRNVREKFWEKQFSDSVAETMKHNGYRNLLQATATTLAQEGVLWFGVADANTMGRAQRLPGFRGEDWHNEEWVLDNHPEMGWIFHADEGQWINTMNTENALVVGGEPYRQIIYVDNPVSVENLDNQHLDFATFRDNLQQAYANENIKFPNANSVDELIHNALADNLPTPAIEEAAIHSRKPDVQFIRPDFPDTQMRFWRAEEELTWDWPEPTNSKNKQKPAKPTGYGKQVYLVYRDVMPKAAKEAARRMGIRSLPGNHPDAPQMPPGVSMSAWLDLRNLNTTKPAAMFSVAATPQFKFAAADQIGKLPGTINRARARAEFNRAANAHGGVSKFAKIIFNRVLNTPAFNDNFAPQTLATALRNEAAKYQPAAQEPKMLHYASYKPQYANDQFPQYGELPFQLPAQTFPEAGYGSQHFHKNTLFWIRYLQNENETLVFEMQTDILSEQIGDKTKANKDDVIESMADSYMKKLAVDVILEMKRRGKKAVLFPAPATAAAVQGGNPNEETQQERTGYGEDSHEISNIINAEIGDEVEYHGDTWIKISQDENYVYIVGMGADTEIITEDEMYGNAQEHATYLIDDDYLVDFMEREILGFYETAPDRANVKELLQLLPAETISSFASEEDADGDKFLTQNDVLRLVEEHRGVISDAAMKWYMEEYNPRDDLMNSQRKWEEGTKKDGEVFFVLDFREEESIPVRFGDSVSQAPEHLDSNPLAFAEYRGGTRLMQHYKGLGKMLLGGEYKGKVQMVGEGKGMPYIRVDLDNIKDTVKGVFSVATTQDGGRFAVKNLYQGGGREWDSSESFWNHIGTGEGRAAFGVGDYNTSNEDVARIYAGQSYYRIPVSERGEIKGNRFLHRKKLDSTLDHGRKKFRWLDWNKPLKAEQWDALIAQAEKEKNEPLIAELLESQNFANKAAARGGKEAFREIYFELGRFFGDKMFSANSNAAKRPGSLEASKFIARAGFDGWQYKTDASARPDSKGKNFVVVNEKIIGRVQTKRFSVADVYQGGPFEWDSSQSWENFVGAGEGFLMFGEGAYFTEMWEVAEFYATHNRRLKKRLLNGKYLLDARGYELTISRRRKNSQTGKYEYLDLYGLDKAVRNGGDQVYKEEHGQTAEETFAEYIQESFQYYSAGYTNWDGKFTPPTISAEFADVVRPHLQELTDAAWAAWRQNPKRIHSVSLDTRRDNGRRKFRWLRWYEPLTESEAAVLRRQAEKENRKEAAAILADPATRAIPFGDAYEGAIAQAFAQATFQPTMKYREKNYFTGKWGTTTRVRNLKEYAGNFWGEVSKFIARAGFDGWHYPTDTSSNGDFRNETTWRNYVVVNKKIIQHKNTHRFSFAAPAAAFDENGKYQPQKDPRFADFYRTPNGKPAIMSHVGEEDIEDFEDATGFWEISDETAPRREGDPGFTTEYRAYFAPSKVVHLPVQFMKLVKNFNGKSRPKINKVSDAFATLTGIDLRDENFDFNDMEDASPHGDVNKFIYALLESGVLTDNGYDMLSFVDLHWGNTDVAVALDSSIIINADTGERMYEKDK